MFTATKSMLEPYGYEVITLAGAGHEVRILPVNGFNLYDWTIDGNEVLMKPDDITAFGAKYGTPILFPTPNRIKDCVYCWNGVKRTQKKRGVPVQRHGLVMDEPFEVTKLEAGEEKAVCAAKIAICEGDGLYEGYPFPCTLTVTYALDNEGVHFDAEIRNDGNEMMPFGLAIHPYFSKRGDANKCFIKVPVKRYYEADADLIPSGKILPVEEEKNICDEFKSVESLYLDTVFRGMSADKEALIKYEDVMLHINSSDCFRNAVVFTPHTRPGFCIEPQTNATDFMNMHARGQIDESGLLVIPAGQTFVCRIDMTAERL